MSKADDIKAEYPDDEYGAYAEMDSAMEKMYQYAKALEQRINRCFQIANGRWCEWGSRAEWAASALEGEEREPE